MKGTDHRKGSHIFVVGNRLPGCFRHKLAFIDPASTRLRGTKPQSVAACCGRRQEHEELRSVTPESVALPREVITHKLPTGLIFVTSIKTFHRPCATDV